MLTHVRISTVGAWLAVGSIFHDTVLPGLPYLSLAKVMFAASVPFLLAGSPSFRLSKIGLAVGVYGVTLLFFSHLFAGGGTTPRTSAVSSAIITGLISFFILSNSRLSISQIKNAFAFWLTASVIVGAIQATTGTGFVDSRQFLSSLIPNSYRASGFLNDPNYFSFLCLIGLSLAITEEGKAKKIRSTVAVVGVILTGSRAGLLGVVALFLVMRSGGFMSVGRLFLLLILSMGVAWLAYTYRHFLPDEIAALMDMQSYAHAEGANSLSFRMMAIFAGIEAFQENPFFGYGIGNLVYHPANPHQMVSHNTYIEILAESGTVGMAAIAIVVIAALRIISMLKGGGHRKEMLSLSLLLIAMLFLSMTLVLHYSRMFFFVWAVFDIYSREVEVKRGSQRPVLRGFSPPTP